MKKTLGFTSMAILKIKFTKTRYNCKIIITIFMVFDHFDLIMKKNIMLKIQAHPFHLVEPSPWPLAASVALLILTITSVLNFHGWTTSLGFSIGVILLLSTMAFWWRDCIRESSCKSLFI